MEDGDLKDITQALFFAVIGLIIAFVVFKVMFGVIGLWLVPIIAIGVLFLWFYYFGSKPIA